MPMMLHDNRMAPQNFSEAMEFATWISKSTMVPEMYRGQPENCLLAIQWGGEVGLGPLQALQDLAVIDGRPALYGDAMLALVRGSGLCESVEEECDDQVAVCRVCRKGEQVVERRFSVEDAARAGLWGMTDTWQKYPSRMLQMRARSWALRDVFPDVLRGVKCVEEVMDYAERRQEPEAQRAVQMEVQAPVVSAQNVQQGVDGKGDASSDAANSGSQAFYSQEKFERNFEKMAEMLATKDKTVDEVVTFFKAHGSPLTEEQIAKLIAVQNGDGGAAQVKPAIPPASGQTKPPLKVVSGGGGYPQDVFEQKLEGWVNLILSGRKTYEHLLVFLNSRGTPLNDEQQSILKSALEEGKKAA